MFIVYVATVAKRISDIEELLFTHFLTFHSQEYLLQRHY